MSVRDKDMGYAAIMRALKREAKAATVDVGFFDETQATKAAANEFGTDTQPERAFFAPAVDTNERAIKRTMAQGIGDAIDRARNTGRLDLEAALIPAGEQLQAAVKDSIRNFSGAPLDPDTIAAKGSDRPLVDSGDMLEAVEVRTDRASAAPAGGGRSRGGDA